MIKKFLISLYYCTCQDIRSFVSKKTLKTKTTWRAFLHFFPNLHPLGKLLKHHLVCEKNATSFPGKFVSVQFYWCCHLWKRLFPLPPGERKLPETWHISWFFQDKERLTCYVLLSFSEPVALRCIHSAVCRWHGGYWRNLVSDIKARLTLQIQMQETCKTWPFT